jgi:hypothetical protein
MADNEEGTDASSIKPVSSLRSRFENLGKDTEKPASPVASLAPETAISNGRSRTPERRRTPSPTPPPKNIGGLQSGVRKRAPSPPKARPVSMMPVTPSQKSPPMLTVDSPQSLGNDASIQGRLGNPTGFLAPSPGGGSPTRAQSRTLSRAVTPVLEKRMSAVLQSDEPPKIDFASKPKPPETNASSLPVKIPPPVNRTAKPVVPSKSATLVPKNASLAAPENKATDPSEQKASPFSTPPSGSGSNSPERRKETAAQRPRNESDASFVEKLQDDSGRSTPDTRLRATSDASFVQHLRGDSQSSFADSRARADSDASFVEVMSSPREGFQPPPIHHHVAARREQQHNHGLSRAPTMPARYRNTQAHSPPETVDQPEDRPRLPARPELLNRSGRTSPIKNRTGRTSPSKLSHQISAQRSSEGLRRAATMDEHSMPYMASAPKVPARHSPLHQGFERAAQAAAIVPPAAPAPRRSADMRRPQILAQMQSEAAPRASSLDIRRPHIPAVHSHTNGQSHDDGSDVAPLRHSDSFPTTASDYPDSSHANRRPPRYPHRPWQIHTDYDTRLLGVCGEYVVTSGYLTKAWNLKTGEQLLNMVHNENVKVTSLAFKPSASLEDEGKRIWVGTNIGEIHEIDIPSQIVVKTKTGAHTRREVIKMFRHASELWTLDDGGEFNVWKPDHKGLPSLDSQYNNFRTPRGHTFSIVCGKHVWIATGKDLRVFWPGARTDTEFQVLRNALNQPNTGEITSGAVISSKPELVYFGHSDGKVSIYNHNDYSCIGVVNVSLYKISSMAGVGEYLWAGYSTGMVYVYDTSTTPWQVKKDWEAHEKKQVCGINADPSALWKMDRLQVVTLGTDNMLRLWDGLLEEDWLDARMQDHDSEYCSFREMTAAVLTWNAGASKPHYLSQNKDDSNFFRDYLTSRNAPDIFVFGFQELVDLEDKKTTAKAFFKSKKKDANNEHEHMSHQYRAWRDHLTRCLEDFMPTDEPYTLLHTASLVGLFTCVFVKTSERQRIKHVHTAEIKRGMGGLHGNKGALIMRMVLDDSSLCFINCHLAAGQTQTMHRNNDIAAILETPMLPPYPLNNTGVAQHSDVFSSGGDGSMILDHEIAILNGDLNYRIDTMGRDTVIKHIVSNNLGRLLERDQLLLSRKKNPGFRLRAFQESPITFAPTYKYNVHSDEYDTSEKRRAPAWCDRILYRGLGKVKMEEYRRWDQLRVSDHRPVSGLLRVRAKRVDAGKREQVWELCQREFDVQRQRITRAVQ